MAKAILVIDIPIDESCETDEYSRAADLHVYPTILTDRPELFIDLYSVAIRSMPKRYTGKFDETGTAFADG